MKKDSNPIIRIIKKEISIINLTYLSIFSSNNFLFSNIDSWISSTYNPEPITQLYFSYNLKKPSFFENLDSSGFCQKYSINIPFGFFIVFSINSFVIKLPIASFKSIS